MQIDTTAEGLAVVFKEYQELAMRYLWRLDGVGANSRDVWEQVNDDLMGVSSISRASIINFLNRMVDEGILTFTERTGKGGHQRVYHQGLTMTEFWLKLARDCQTALTTASEAPDLFETATQSL